MVGDEKMKKVFVLMVLGLILLGCVQEPNEKDNKTDLGKNNETDLGGDKVTTVVVASGDSIKVEYVGKFPDTGEVFDKSEGRGPLEFVAGAGQMIKGFDAAVLGMKLNEEKTVVIPPEDAYGTADSGQKLQVPLDQIGGDGQIEVGSVLFTSDGKSGTVIAIEDGTATIEFVNPMAGKTLEFWIKVVEINKA